MTTVVQILISTLLSALVLWLSIKIVERHNEANSFPVALIIGLVFSVFGSFCSGPLIILPLVAMMFILLRFYELGLIKSVIVVILMGALNVAIGLVLGTFLATLGLV